MLQGQRRRNVPAVSTVGRVIITATLNREFAKPDNSARLPARPPKVDGSYPP